MRESERQREREKGRESQRERVLPSEIDYQRATVTTVTDKDSRPVAVTAGFVLFCETLHCIHRSI